MLFWKYSSPNWNLSWWTTITAFQKWKVFIAFILSSCWWRFVVKLRTQQHPYIHTSHAYSDKRSTENHVLFVAVGISYTILQINVEESENRERYLVIICIFLWGKFFRVRKFMKSARMLLYCVRELLINCSCPMCHNTGTHCTMHTHIHTGAKRIANKRIKREKKERREEININSKAPTREPPKHTPSVHNRFALCSHFRG